MGSNAAIDVAISLVLMYLVLSLIVTVLNEVIATAADLRSSNLKDALTALIDDPTVRSQFYNHGLIAGVNNATADDKGIFLRFINRLYRYFTKSDTVDEAHVSYVSGQVFARALLGSVDVTKDLPTYQEIEDAIKNLPNSDVRDALLAQLTTADGDLQLLHENVAAWFDNAMARVSGVYKRHLKQISLVVGIILVLVVNADTLKVAKALWNDASLRATMVQTAGDLVKAGPPSNSPPKTTAPATGNAGGQAAQTPQPNAVGNAGGQAAQAPPAAGNAGGQAAQTPQPNAVGNAGGQAAQAPLDLDKAIASIRTSEQQLRPLPLGWDWSSVAWPWPWPWTWTAWHVFVKIIGLLLTAIAISLGAPFWFDLLSMFMKVRGTGDKPEKTSET